MDMPFSQQWLIYGNLTRFSYAHKTNVFEKTLTYCLSVRGLASMISEGCRGRWTLPSNAKHNSDKFYKPKFPTTINRQVNCNMHLSVLGCTLWSIHSHLLPGSVHTVHTHTHTHTHTPYIMSQVSSHLLVPTVCVCHQDRKCQPIRFVCCKHANQAQLLES